MAERKCEFCGGTFESPRRAKYCSGSHRAQAAKERKQSRNKTQPGRSSALTRALTTALRSAEASKADGAIKALAKVYARQIDAEPSSVKDLGPQLRLVLVELHMTPKSRVTSTPPAVRGGVVGGDNPPDWLDDMRNERGAGPDRTTDLDSPTS